MNNKLSMTLLFGMPRSGTTWIGKIFDSHPDTLYRHEPDSQYPLDSIPLFFESTDTTQQSSEVQFFSDFIESFSTIRDSKVCAKLPLFHKNYLNTLQNVFLKGSIYITKNPFIPLREQPYHRGE